MSVIVKYIGQNIEGLTKRRTEEGQDSPYLSIDQVKMFKPILGFLNEKDRDILYLIFVSKKKQRDVQRILGRSQSSLAYDIKRIRKRLKFIVYLHERFDTFMDFVKNQSVYFTSFEMSILTLMFYTSSFTMTASILDVSQVKVRYAYNKCLVRMWEMDMFEAYEIFIIIRSNLNIIKRICSSKLKGSSIFLPV